MDKDRVAGAARHIKGVAKEAIGRATGDTKIAAEGNAEKALGSVQNAIGRIKDAARNALRK